MRREIMNIQEKVLRPDSKGRINLGKLTQGISGFKMVYDKNSNKIILEPYIEMPLQEEWLFKNREALRRVKIGLMQSSQKNIKDLGSFSKYIDE